MYLCFCGDDWPELVEVWRSRSHLAPRSSNISRFAFELKGILLRAFSVLRQPYSPPPGYLLFYYRKLLHHESFPARNPILHFSPLILIRRLFFKKKLCAYKIEC